jgi:hypothetical protein
LDQRRPTAGRVLACVPGLREGSGSVAVQPLSDFERSLDLCQDIERPAPEVCRALVELESRTIPVLREVGVIGPLREEQKHDQVDCCCWLRVIGCNIGASYDACADSSAGGYDHASRGRLRRWQDTS